MQKVAIPTGETDFTSFQVLSPEEIRIAKVCNFVRRHRLGEMSEDDTWAFRRILMSVPTAIRVMDSVETFFVRGHQASQRYHEGGEVGPSIRKTSG